MHPEDVLCKNECRRIFILNIQLRKHIIDNIRSAPLNWNEFTRSCEAIIR